MPSVYFLLILILFVCVVSFLLYQNEKLVNKKRDSLYSENLFKIIVIMIVVYYFNEPTSAEKNSSFISAFPSANLIDLTNLFVKSGLTLLICFR